MIHIGSQTKQMMGFADSSKLFDNFFLKRSVVYIYNPSSKIWILKCEILPLPFAPSPRNLTLMVYHLSSLSNFDFSVPWWYTNCLLCLTLISLFFFSICIFPLSLMWINCSILVWLQCEKCITWNVYLYLLDWYGHVTCNDCRPRESGRYITSRLCQ